MKRFLLILCAFLFLNVQAQPLKGGVSEDYIPSGFFGSWGVISKLDSSNNPTMFNYESRDIWTLSGHNKTLVLQNLQSGAHSEITIKDKSKDGRTLKFHREKTVPNENGKTIYKETVRFTLYGKHFSGTDKFSVQQYDRENKLIKDSQATYIVEGVRISGESPSY
jgi:hypothetical protein